MVPYFSGANRAGAPFQPRLTAISCSIPPGKRFRFSESRKKYRNPEIRRNGRVFSAIPTTALRVLGFNFSVSQKPTQLTTVTNITPTCASSWRELPGNVSFFREFAPVWSCDVRLTPRLLIAFARLCLLRHGMSRCGMHGEQLPLISHRADERARLSRRWRHGGLGENTTRQQ